MPLGQLGVEGEEVQHLPKERKDEDVEKGREPRENNHAPTLRLLSPHVGRVYDFVPYQAQYILLFWLYYYQHLIGYARGGKKRIRTHAFRRDKILVLM